MFPVATLKVETYEGFIPVAVTARLSSKQLERIVEEAQNAQKKVTALRTLLTERQIYIPEAGAQADDDDEGRTTRHEGTGQVRSSSSPATYQDRYAWAAAEPAAGSRDDGPVVEKVCR